MTRWLITQDVDIFEESKDDLVPRKFTYLDYDWDCVEN